MNEGRKAREINYIITWLVRVVAFVAEVLFFVPLCVVSCSSQPDSDKSVGGMEATFGFELSYIEDSVVGIWWFGFVFVLTAIIIALWIVKDMNRLKDFKLRKILLCFMTGVFAAINVIIMICFIRVANLRVEAANEGFAVGVVSIRYTFGFGLLMFIQIMLCLGGFGTLIWQLVKNREILKTLFGVVKKRININNEERVRKRKKIT